MMIASIGPCLPHDLFAATGRYNGPLEWDVSRATPRADRWLESKFAPWTRSILERWAEGAYDHLEAVVFSRVDDSAQRLYYYLCELQRSGAMGGPAPILLDIAKVPRTSSADHSIAALRKLADRFAVSDAALEAGIVATNMERGAELVETSAPACLIAGTPPPDRRLHLAVETAGFAAFGATLADLWRDPGPRVAEATGDPAAAIGRQLHQRPDDQRGFTDSAARIAADARRIDAKAAVLWYTEEDEARVWSVPAARATLADAEIPTLVLTRRGWTAKDGAPEEIGGFLAGISA
ncbi:hypothetical protein [Sphingosinithalassobacter sp. CS137]|uniref:hypothetical protein n=1 Tax=Sphingosinithalassobacter sp. CS137 TaxID=2762748 RepID=UPI00165D7C12|nr:hypothetical protein [Sphingosinithalassobacter sp. CS137]